jgi:hypothetical protein
VEDSWTPTVIALTYVSRLMNRGWRMLADTSEFLLAWDDLRPDRYRSKLPRREELPSCHKQEVLLIT